MKKAFTIIEIVIVVFVLSLFFAIVVPLIVNDTQEKAERVAAWNTAYKEFSMAHSLRKIQQDNWMDLYHKHGNDFVQECENYFNVKFKKLSSNYKYTFMNGKKVPQDSKYYFKTFAKREDDTVVGFKVLNEHCSVSQPCVSVMVDLNGENKPNRIGLDIFGVDIYSDNARPWGENESDRALRRNCSKIGEGTYCSQYYLIGGSFIND